MTGFRAEYQNPRRALGDTIAELAESVLTATVPGSNRATRIELSMPIELSFAEELLGDLPLYRRATAFDAPPANLTLVLSEVDANHAWVAKEDDA